MIIFIIAFTAAVTFLTVSDNAPSVVKKTTKELYEEGKNERR